MLDTARLRGSWCATLLVIASLLLAVLDASNALPFCARTILGVVAWFACFALVLFHVRSLPAPTSPRKTIHRRKKSGDNRKKISKHTAAARRACKRELRAAHLRATEHDPVKRLLRALEIKDKVYVRGALDIYNTLANHADSWHKKIGSKVMLDKFTFHYVPGK